MIGRGVPAEEIDTSRPHPARMYDYFLGGKDNYEVDREAAHRIMEAAPEVRLSVRSNRAFLHRAVRFLVDSGIEQILDIGTGLPTSPNVHEVAHAIDPRVRVAYVDNDPIVNVHANALLTNTGGTRIVLADIRDPRAILDHPDVRQLIDFDRPVGLLLVAILHFLTDADDPRQIVTTLRDALPSGSYLVLSHATNDIFADRTEAVSVYNQATATLNLRNHAEITRFFDGFELFEPGLVQVPFWRPEGPIEEGAGQVGFYGAVGRKTD